MHGPVKPIPVREPAAPASSTPGEHLREGDDTQLREALHLVLNVNVYDCAGRAVTVKDMLRGSLATQVRVALDRKRPS